MLNSVGQDVEYWNKFWHGLTPESEIKMWDYYGGRPYILKYVPRFGKIIEAGCGLGRYVYYLSQFGIDIEGIDFEKNTVDRLIQFNNKNKLNAKFRVGDVTKLPYDNESLSGYVSLGVIEHFIEGPDLALKEAYRVLRPGGMAVITTPNLSFSVRYLKMKLLAKSLIKRIAKIQKKDTFVQYWYTTRKLKNFIENAGLFVSFYRTCDLLYPFIELGFNVEKNKFPLWFSNRFEPTFLSMFGAQSVTISIKKAAKMYCFLCGKLNANEDSLKKYQVPICGICTSENLSKYYTINSNIMIKEKLKMIIPNIKAQKLCELCSSEIKYSDLFEDFGFTKNICTDCLIIPQNNIYLSNECIKPKWGERFNNIYCG